MDWKDLMEGLGRGAFQRHPNESDHKFRERIMKMGTTVLTPPGALTQGELEREIGWAVNQFAGTKVTPQLLGIVKSAIQNVLDTFERADRFPAGIGKPSFDVRIDASQGQFDVSLKFANGFGMSDHFTWEIPLPVEEKKETVSLVREDAPWFWGR